MPAAESASNSKSPRLVQERTNSGCSQTDTLNTPLLSRQDSLREVGSTFNSGYEGFLFVFVPIGIIAGALNLAPVAVFVLNFLGVVPLAPFITMAVVRLSAHAGIIWGGLLKAILVNAVEMMICVISLGSSDIRLVQTVIIGSVLSYSLLVLGGCLLYTSCDRVDIRFDRTQISIMSSLAMVVCVSIALPTVISWTDLRAQRGLLAAGKDALNLSRGTAIVILILFVSYLAFRFGSHPNLFPHVITRTNSSVQLPFSVRLGPHSLPIFLLGAFACASISIHYLVRSVDDTIEKLKLTKSFIGVVVLPLVGNGAKSATIIKTSRGRRLDYALRAIMSNILDTLLFITPLMVLLGWAINQPMELDFGLFELTVILLAMILVTSLLQHGKSTYFEGFMLIGTYLTFAVAFYLRPETQD